MSDAGLLRTHWEEYRRVEQMADYKDEIGLKVLKGFTDSIFDVMLKQRPTQVFSFHDARRKKWKRVWRIEIEGLGEGELEWWEPADKGRGWFEKQDEAFGRALRELMYVNGDNVYNGVSEGGGAGEVNSENEDVEWNSEGEVRMHALATMGG